MNITEEKTQLTCPGSSGTIPPTDVTIGLSMCDDDDDHVRDILSAITGPGNDLSGCLML